MAEMPYNIMYGKTGAVYRQESCFCEYVDQLRTNMVAAYVQARETMGKAANKQRVYHDEDNATRFSKPGDWILY